MAAPYYPDWPSINSVIAKQPKLESAVQKILKQMTLEEKVGQMIQPDLRSVTPEEAKRYKLGSLLNGGGGWPGGDKYATAKDWAELSESYYLALEDAYKGRGFRIPFMWATDAVHGHNNVFRATVFPHNIGLGAAHNPDLIEQIGAATAKEIVATGLDWTFAPTVAVPRDYRWGRVYEGYSEDPAIVYSYAGRMVRGLQGDAKQLASDRKVISTVKHWVGDGGTTNGVDRGENHYSEDYLRNIHASGYFSGLAAGAQAVMSSFNSWHSRRNYDLTGKGEYNHKIHGSRYLITDVLKTKMGFDGLVVTDWNGQAEINGCTPANCPQAVNAGNDLFMVTSREDWQRFYHNVIAQVKQGIIPVERIDDAVTRILRVKMRAGLWKKPLPTQRTFAGDSSLLGADEHRALAREAVSQSLVLLKDRRGILPLQASGQTYLVVGSAADDIQKQTGGWSLTWQGTENRLEADFPGADTLLMAMRSAVGSENVFTDIEQAPGNSIAIVVMGEEPYAEMMGDIKRSRTLDYATLKPAYSEDVDLVRTLKKRGFRVVTLFYSGRPLYMNEVISLSDAFIAAWLPGTEAKGITDVLFAKQQRDFTGRLSYSWPATKCSTAINRPATNLPGYATPTMEQIPEGVHKPLFPYGYGLSYVGRSELANGYDLDNLPSDPRDYGCGQAEPDRDEATESLQIFGRASTGDFVARISGEVTGWLGSDVSNGKPTAIDTLVTTPINYRHQQDALHVAFKGDASAQIYMEVGDLRPVDLNRYLNADATLQFDIDIKSPAPERFTVAAQCQWPCWGGLDISNLLPQASKKQQRNWTTIKLPLRCLAKQGMDFSELNIPFLINVDEAVEFNLGEVRYVPRAIDPAEDAISCEQL